MRLGLNTFLYASPFTTEQAPKLFAKLKKWGFETVEIPVEALEHIDPAKVKAAADKAGLKIGSICACMGPGRDFRGSAADQKTAVDYVRGLIDQAVALGCPSVIGPLYSVVGLTAPNARPKTQPQPTPNHHAFRPQYLSLRQPFHHGAGAQTFREAEKVGL